MRSFDGIVASQMNLAAVRQILTRQATHHSFAVRRDGKDRTLGVTIRLQPVSSLH